jgi:lipopolysaccharide/colanic/teichoic acid biosynthesis glycosyltransferase
VPASRRLIVRQACVKDREQQVSGPSDMSWNESIGLDRYYVGNGSTIQDLLILARTVGAGLTSRGAY